MTSLIEGIYTSVKDDAFVEYVTKCGMPKDQAQKMKGSHWRLAIRKTEDSTWVGHLTCDEMPQANSLNTLKEGQETEVDSPLFGGKTKMTFKKTGDNTAMTIMNSETYGITEFNERYTDDGVHFRSVNKKSGAVLEDFWPREIKEEGWFKAVSTENVEKFMKVTGFPYAGDAYKFRMCKCGDIYNVTEVTNVGTNTFKFKLDEEFNYQLPGFPSADRKVIVTKMGNGKYKSFYKGKSGQSEEWEVKFCPNGATWSGVDKVSGQTCKIVCESFANVCGTFKILAETGALNYLSALDFPREIVEKAMSDYEATQVISETNGVYRSVYTGKYMCLDTSYKMGEEYTDSFPGVPGTFKVVKTLCGNTVTTVSKGPKFTTRVQLKFTDSYMIETAKILGTDITMKIIFERVQ